MRVLISGLIAMTVAAASPALAISSYYTDPAKCIPAAEQAASEKGIAKSDITNVHMDVVMSGSAGEAKPPPDFVAWLTVRQCVKGAVLVHMTDTCLVRQVYTRGGCRIDGIPGY